MLVSSDRSFSECNSAFQAQLLQFLDQSQLPIPVVYALSGAWDFRSLFAIWSLEILNQFLIFGLIVARSEFSLDWAFGLTRLATVRSGPDRGLFWRLLKRPDCTVQSFVGLDWTVPKDCTVRRQ